MTAAPPPQRGYDGTEWWADDRTVYCHDEPYISGNRVEYSVPVEMDELTITEARRFAAMLNAAADLAEQMEAS